jgi:Ca-activated chloride channel homolog
MSDFFSASLLMYWPTFEFKDPVFLWSLLLAPLMFWFATRAHGSVKYSSIAVAQMARPSWRVRLRWLPGGLCALAVACLAIALAGPRSGDSTTRLKREGIAIMLVVDRSGSMDARDFVEGDYSINRLEAVKRVLRSFVLGGEQSAGRPDDLIGVVAFGTYADSVSPLTLDHANLINIVNQLEVATTQTEAATAIGEGLGLAIERLREHPAKSKVVVLLTDGVNNAGNLQPQQAAELAVDQGIKVYAVGAGTTGIAPVPRMGSDGRMRLAAMQVEIDEKTLREISARTGAQYFHAQNADALNAAYAQIDALERSEISETRFLQYREHYVWLLVAAFVLLLSAEIIGHTILRRLP